MNVYVQILKDHSFHFSISVFFFSFLREQVGAMLQKVIEVKLSIIYIIYSRPSEKRKHVSIIIMMN